jgi:hypothetical protein
MKPMTKQKKPETKKKSPRRFETLVVHTSKPIILTDKIGSPKLYFMV